MAHDLFISYSSQNKAAADAVCTSLERRGIRCWIAPRDVPPGEVWSGRLVRAIAQARVLVLILSDGANRSEQVLREVAEAAERKMPIVSFRIEDVKPSEDLRYFVLLRQWLEAANPPLEEHLRALGDLLTELLAKPATASPAAPPATWEQRLAECTALLEEGDVEEAVGGLSALAVDAEPEGHEIARQARGALLAAFEKAGGAHLPHLVSRVVKTEQWAVARLLAGLRDPVTEREAWDLCSAVYRDASPRVRETLAAQAYIDGDAEIENKTRALLAWSALAGRLPFFALAYDRPRVGRYLAESLQHLELGAPTARDRLVRVLSGAWSGKITFAGFQEQVVPQVADCLGQMQLEQAAEGYAVESGQVAAILRRELLRIGRGGLWTVVREIVGQSGAPREASPACWPETAGVLHSAVRQLGDARFAWPVADHCRAIEPAGSSNRRALEEVVRSLVTEAALAERLLERRG